MAEVAAVEGAEAVAQVVTVAEVVAVALAEAARPCAGSSSSTQGEFGALPPFPVWSSPVPPRACWQVWLAPAFQGDSHRRGRWHLLGHWVSLSRQQAAEQTHMGAVHEALWAAVV